MLVYWFLFVASASFVPETRNFFRESIWRLRKSTNHDFCSFKPQKFCAKYARDIGETTERSMNNEEYSQSSVVHFSASNQFQRHSNLKVLKFCYFWYFKSFLEPLQIFIGVFVLKLRWKRIFAQFQWSLFVDKMKKKMTGDPWKNYR